MNNDNLYTMTIDLNILDHLGINLYSNIAAVLTEVVANAWDADAHNVYIDLNERQDEIVITDDGIGMDVADMNTKYLHVGYRRRIQDAETGTKTALGRPVMGRKGLGKLSLFSIANTVEIYSNKNGNKAGCIIKVEDIHRAVEDNSQYNPIPIPENEIDLESGTKIVLKDLKRQRLGVGMTALKKRLARRFSIIGERHDFKVYINGNPVTSTDRGDLPKVQFLWKFENTELEESDIEHVLEKTTLPSRKESWDDEWNVTGWIGTAKRPKDLDSEDAGNLNGIVVFSRGRLFHENILEKLNDGRLYTKYITGQIEADFLDLDDEPDIATSDRQRIQEDDPRYRELIDFLRESLNSVERKWNDWRKKYEVKKAVEHSPALAEWLNNMKGGFRESAEQMIAKLGALPLDKEEDRKVLLKHGILAFERMKLRGSTEEFSKSIDNIEDLLKILADRDTLEASLYRDIVKSRLDAIKEFQGLVDANDVEKALQKYLFDHMWLLDPSWERATGSELMETRLLEEGVIVEDLSEKEKMGRVDIKYKTVAGKHIIVELKRAERKMKLLELQEQGQLYVDKLKKILHSQGVNNPNIEVVFVIGKPVDEEKDNVERLKASMEAISPGSRIVHYDTLIHGAEQAYSDYLEKTKELDKLESIVNSL